MQHRRTTHARPLAEIVGALMTPACRRRGIANAALMLDPADIFGARFARSAAVERIVWPRGSRIDGEPDGATATGATLVVRADAATALALQHVAPQIIERVNILIGWPAVERLRLTQAHGPPRRPRGPAPQPGRPAADAPVPERLAAPVEGVDDPDLKAALARLGAGVARRALTRGRGRP